MACFIRECAPRLGIVLPFSWLQQSSISLPALKQLNGHPMSFTQDWIRRAKSTFVNEQCAIRSIVWEVLAQQMSPGSEEAWRKKPDLTLELPEQPDRVSWKVLLSACLASCDHEQEKTHFRSRIDIRLDLVFLLWARAHPADKQIGEKWSVSARLLPQQNKIVVVSSMFSAYLHGGDGWAMAAILKVQSSSVVDTFSVGPP